MMLERLLITVLVFGATHMTHVEGNEKPNLTSCPAPTPPANGFIVEAARDEHGYSLVRFECFPGYNIRGPDVMTCREDGTWEDQIPIECAACPIGTYKNDTVTRPSCYDCPEQTPTAFEGSQSIQQCMCHEGGEYRRWADGVCRPCPSGYEDRHGRVCYVITNERLDVWTSARDKCFDIGGYLLEVDNKEEQAHIRNLLGQVTTVDTNWWIGYNDRASEGDFTWPHLGDSGDYTNWASGEPSHHRDEDCAVIANHRAYGWNDVTCEPVQFAYICERYIDF